jgi:hypothetical protein
LEGSFLILLTRARDVAAIKPGFTGDGLLRKQEALATAYALDPKVKFEGPLGDWGDMKAQLSLESAGKCAYCEVNASAVTYGDVEHFRPKSVYWWLALCVDNYVYSCQQCNQHFKKNDFPIGKQMLASPQLHGLSSATPERRAKMLALMSPDPCLVDESTLARQWNREAPFLPHPYLENPEPLFAWKVVETNQEVMLVEPQRPSLRARRAVKAAVENLGLNRAPLPNLRWLIYDSLVERLNTFQNGSAPKRAQAYSRIRQMCGKSHQFAGMCRYFTQLAGVQV